MRLVLATVGIGLIAIGVLVAIVSTLGVGIALMLIGVLTLVLAGEWHEVEAQYRVLRLRVAKAPPTPPPVEPRPDVRILGMRATGGGSGFVEFVVEVVNYGTQQCRCTMRADVAGTAVNVEPPTVDLIPNDPPRDVRVVVPRPAIGDLVPEFAHETTLYGRTLTVVVADGEREVRETWHELVYDSTENAVRAEIQRRVWRLGLGDGTEADEIAARQSELLRRHEERVEGEP